MLRLLRIRVGDLRRKSLLFRRDGERMDQLMFKDRKYSRIMENFRLIEIQKDLTVLLISTGDLRMILE
jgi:hypothetical protein